MFSSCPHCGTGNDSSRVRCAACGAATSSPSRAVRTQRTPRETLPCRPGRAESELGAPSARTRLPAAALENAEAFLVSEVLDAPYPLHPTYSVSIGRGSDNHVILPVQQVSRHHATILGTGDGFEIVDRGSMNGTRVNGELIVRRRLAENDAIRIGPIEIVFGTHILESIPRGGECDTAQDWGPVLSQSSFAGVLSHLRLAEVWQMLELGHKTGRLLLQHGDQRGTVHFSEGRAVHAELGSLSGEDAALALLLVGAGTFRFLPAPRVEAAATIRRTSTALLLEAARLADEEARLADEEAHDAREVA